MNPAERRGHAPPNPAAQYRVSIDDSNVSGNVVIGGTTGDITSTTVPAQPASPTLRGAFVSYLREDEAMVGPLVDALRRAGVEVWIDIDRLRGGELWRERIIDAINQDGAFLLCLSHNFAARPDNFVVRELEAAIESQAERTKTDGWIVPVRLDDTPLPAIDLTPSHGGANLADLHAIDWFRDSTAALATIIDALR